MKKETIILASDHAGFELKEAIKKHLDDKGYKTEDVGAFKYQEDDDFPEFMVKAASMIAQNPDGSLKAVIFGGSGQGEAMVANRFPGVRAAVWYGGTIEIVKKSREHNNANILSIGARFVDIISAQEAVDTWLVTPFSGDDRHERRIEQMDSIE